jgi:glycosyltransferase involved in cell wall biosynthesis
MPTFSLCIPHWQVKGLVGLCLHSIRRHSPMDDVEILVIDNGSRDESLDYLRSLSWIRLIERPEESFANWPANVFTAWDLGIRHATGEYFVTMHSDVLIRQPGWLERLAAEFDCDPLVAGVGAWKLDLEPLWYSLQKEVFGAVTSRLKGLLGRRGRSQWSGGRYPRDYCAMYRRETIVRNNLSFWPGRDPITGGYAIARQLWGTGYQTRLIPTREMARYMVHVAHGTAALAAEKPLHHAAAQRKVERRVAALFAEPWVQSLRAEVVG